MSKPIDIAGQAFGELTAIAPTGRRSAANNRIWMFRCACGNSREADGVAVRSGRITTCHKCAKQRAILRQSTHGLTNTAEFRIWTDIHTRCYNQRRPEYPNYGGRGIRMCKRWRASFADFLSDMGSRPSPHHSIDRINNDGNYEPGNCRWATRREQALNRRTNVLVTINGQRRTLSEWAEQSGIAFKTVYRRWKAGWNIYRLLTPIRTVSK